MRFSLVGKPAVPLSLPRCFLFLTQDECLLAFLSMKAGKRQGRGTRKQKRDLYHILIDMVVAEDKLLARVPSSCVPEARQEWGLGSWSKGGRSEGSRAKGWGTQGNSTQILDSILSRFQKVLGGSRCL